MKLLWGVLWLLIPCVVSGQDSKKADKLFEQGAWHKALGAYLELLADRPENPGNKQLFYRVGVCHLRTANYRGAQEWLERAILADTEADEAYNRLGEAYLYQGNYVKAKEAFQHYQRLNPDDERLENRIASCNFALKAPKENPRLLVEPFSSLNTSGNEYGILPVYGGLLYLSTGEGVPERDRSPRTGLGYSKPHLAYLQDGEYQPGVLLKGIFRKKAEAGSFACDAASGELWCVRCEGQPARCGIVKARLKGARLQKTGALKIGDGHFNLAHPFVEEQSGRLYFSSAMEGGYGASDIWYVDRTPDGRWGEPENLGPEVNTPGNELFPYLWEGALFFASDGHVGYGGLDLFRSDPEGELWGRVQNLGAGMNTSYDDFNLIIHRDGKSGLFVSNRDPGQGVDIFQFGIRSFVIAMRGSIRDKETGQALEQASVELLSGGTEQTVAADAAGKFSVDLTRGVTCRLTVTAPGYRPLTEEVKMENFQVKLFDREHNRLEKSYLLEPVGDRFSETEPDPEEPEIPTVVERERWEVLSPPEKRSAGRELPQTAQLAGLRQVLNGGRPAPSVEVKEGELTGRTGQTGWWIQVAMLRESESLPAGSIADLRQLTGKQVVGYRGTDGGRRFYIGVYREEQEARRVVALLKGAGIDCFVKRVTE